MIHLILNELSAPVSVTPAPLTSETGEGDAVTRYLVQAGQHPRLDPEAELALGRRIQAGRKADGELTKDAAQALQELAAANMRLVYYVATSSFDPARDEIPDLLSAGSVGLMKSAREFDPCYGHRFSTYAFWNIRSHMLRELHGRHRAVQLPRNIHEKLSRLRQEESRLTQELGRTPTEEALAEAMGCTPEQLAELQAHRQHGVSLDETVQEEGGTTLGDLLRDEQTETPAESADRTSDRELVRQLLKSLDSREAEVLRRRSGMDGPEMTFDEIGRHFGISRERVRQIEANALKKLRLAARS